MHRRGTLIFCLFLLAIKGFGQISLPVHFTNDSSKNTTIGSFTQRSVTYISLSELVNILTLNSFVNEESQKLQFHAGIYTMKVTANNPYIIVTDEESNANVLQLSAPVLFTDNSFFVPASDFVPMMDNLLPERITFNETGRLLRVSTRPAKSRFDITGIEFDTKTNGYLVRIIATKPLVDYETWTKEIGNDTWLYITIPDARADVKTLQAIKQPGVLKRVLVFQSPTSVQLTLRMKGTDLTSVPMPAENSNDILMALHFPEEQSPLLTHSGEQHANPSLEKNRWLLDCIVIDAGHGGKDPGAIGVTRTKEKDITLAIALKLGKLIKKNLPQVKVVYTRKKDEFIELYRRGQIANEALGKLFISIHCNSMPRKPHPSNGFEIYLLRPGKTENAIRIAEQENDVVKLEAGYEERYQKLTDEHFILLTMAQSAYVKYSEQFADILQQQIDRQTDIANNGVKQAGFFVLVGASMPNVLVETGYISNKHDEKILKSQHGQQTIADALFNAVKRYKFEYEKSLEGGRNTGSTN